MKGSWMFVLDQVTWPEGWPELMKLQNCNCCLSPIARSARGARGACSLTCGVRAPPISVHPNTEEHFFPNPPLLIISIILEL